MVALLQEHATNDGEHKSRFFTTLHNLDRRQGMRLSDYIHWPLTDGRAVRLRAGHSDRVVVILRADSYTIPGVDTQYLLLLDQEGHLLDRLSCEISNRLTGRRGGDGAIFRTRALRRAAEDGAQLVIRFIPEEGGSIAGSSAHEINYRGRTYRFSWDQDKPGSIRSAEWEKKGLCRVAVREK
jgi:hypothetical protein